MPITMIRTSKCPAYLAESRSKFHQDVVDGLIPPPIKLGPRASALPDFELDAIQKFRIAGRTADEIRVLVRQMVEARKAA